MEKGSLIIHVFWDFSQWIIENIILKFINLWNLWYYLQYCLLLPLFIITALDLKGIINWWEAHITIHANLSLALSHFFLLLLSIAIAQILKKDYLWTWEVQLINFINNFDISLSNIASEINYITEVIVIELEFIWGKVIIGIPNVL